MGAYAPIFVYPKKWTCSAYAGEEKHRSTKLLPDMLNQTPCDERIYSVSRDAAYDH